MLPGFRGMIQDQDMRTPLDFERELLLPEGSIYGLEMSVPNLGPFRPSWRSPVIKNLYLAGASTNPGGGVPLVMNIGDKRDGVHGQRPQLVMPVPASIVSLKTRLHRST